MKSDTQALKEAIESLSSPSYQDWTGLLQTYHTARLADAMERIASHLENSQISTLEGADIVNQLAIIAGRIH